MNNPIYAIKKCNVVQLIENAPNHTPFAFGDCGQEKLIDGLNTLPIDKQSRLNMSSVANYLEDSKTPKMVGGANKGIEWVIRSLKPHREAIGKLYQFPAYSHSPKGISYDTKRIHLDDEVEIKCKECGEVLRHPGTDFIYVPSPSKRIIHGCDNCGTYKPLFELEGIDDSHVYLRLCGEQYWEVQLTCSVKEMAYKHHCK